VQIIGQTEASDVTVADVCRLNGISELTFYRWRKRCGDMQVSEVRRLRELEAQGAETHHVVPGKPWQNAFRESFHASLRDKCPSGDQPYWCQRERLHYDDRHTEALPLRAVLKMGTDHSLCRTPKLVIAF